jgi:hypothetical protein
MDQALADWPTSIRLLERRRGIGVAKSFLKQDRVDSLGGNRWGQRAIRKTRYDSPRPVAYCC